MPVLCRNDYPARCNSRRLKRKAQALLEALRRPKAVLSLWLTGDRQMARLNEQWMQRAGPTDVLSFSQAGGPSDLLGDLVISVERAARSSPRQPEGEIVHLLIHGILHLVGYDHVNLKLRRRMERESDRLSRFLDQIHV